MNRFLPRCVIGTCLAWIPTHALAQDPEPSARVLRAERPAPEEFSSGLASFSTAMRRAGLAADSRITSEPEMNKVKIPVLLPARSNLVANMSIVTREDFYMATSKGPNITVSVSGSRVAIDPPASAPISRGFRTQKSETPRVRATETGFDMNFVRYGIPYTINVECDNKKDSRCTKENYIRTLSKEMVLVGGDPQ